MTEQIPQQRIEQLEQRVAHLTHLLEVATVLNSVLLGSDLGTESILSYLMDAAADITNSEDASVLLWDEAQGKLFFSATTSDSPVAMDLIGQPVPLDSIAGTTFKENKIVQVGDATSDPRHYSQLDEENEFVTRSLLAVPMVASKKIIGVLEVVNKRELPWTEADSENLSMLAGEAAITIQIAQLFVDLHEANKELSELDKLKSDFIAIASHELRTPLGIIMGYVSFLQISEDEEISKQADKAMDGAIQLRSIIDNMVSLRYLRQKESEITRKVTPLKTIIDDLEKDLRTLTDTDSRQIVIGCLDGDAMVFVDRGRIGMALTNVIKNALSFTRPDGVIEVEACRHDDREAHITITDDGIGLEEEQLENIFKEFYQVEDYMVRKHGGLGVGLSICRALVDVNGGRIWASSPGLNKGSTFTISLPLAEQE